MGIWLPDAQIPENSITTLSGPVTKWSSDMLDYLNYDVNIGLQVWFSNSPTNLINHSEAIQI